MKRLNENQLRQFYLKIQKQDKNFRFLNIFFGIGIFIIGFIIFLINFYWENDWVFLISLIIIGLGIVLGSYGAYCYRNLKEEIEANEFK